MKFLLPLLFTGLSFGAKLELDPYDQMKLADFLHRLPSHISILDEEEIPNGLRVRSSFPQRPDGFEIKCVIDYYGPRKTPSDAQCSIEIDTKHYLVKTKNDEVRISDDSESTVSALRKIMNEGNLTKLFRAGYADKGIDYNGKSTLVFHYLFECTKKKCLYRFSNKKLK